ncbi:hypothetical protein D7Z54_06490 [Salibacterium salarium]|uniref:Uncharacterized protein n=1 Tax=Salibacterium salarium TaxID=284579 RepID=A0A3R9QMQ2_9BACI|nr:hypothetical protein D7Z54_06490 [Salibacterium salarium]
MLIWGSIDPSPFEKVLGITWIQVTSHILVGMLSLGTISNLLRINDKDKELKLKHVKNAFILNVFGFLIYGWPILSTWFG